MLKNKRKKPRDKLKQVLCMFLCILSIASSLSIRVYASPEDKDYYSHLTKDQMDEIFELGVGDIPDPWSWVMDTQTYTIIEMHNDGNLTFWWNVPNIQMTFQNMLYDVITISGYGNGIGVPAKETEWLVKIPSNPKTALEKYGFSIPSPAYIGERPLITIDILGVVIPDGFIDGAGRLGALIFKGRCFDAPTDEDMDSLVYVSPKDYNATGMSFQKWVEKHWYEAIEDTGKLGKTQKMDGKKVHAQILVSDADEEGMKDGKQWIAENIIWQEGLDEPGLSAEHICSELQQICGKYYSDVCKNIILVSGIGNDNKVERIMPYDLKRMDSRDKALFDGIVDPRTETQENLFSTGYMNTLTNMLKNICINLSGKISEITVALNSIANFSFLENIGLNPVKLWSSNIVQLLIIIAMCIFIFFILKSAFQVLKGNYSTIKLVTKVLGAFVIVMAVWAFGSNPESTYNHIKDISSKVFTLGNVVFEQNEKIQSLYGTGDSDDKEAVNLWLPYYNMWSIYHTNYGLMDNEQTINLESDKPEIKNLESSGGIPEIDGVQQTLWSTILSNSFTEKANYSGNVYRVVDHFMAPRITHVELEDDKIVDIDVKKNENYKGERIQSNVDFMNMTLQLLLLILVIFKVLLFFEFILNIAMLLVSLCLATSDNYKILLLLKELGASMLNVMFINIILGLVVYTSLLTSGFISLLVCIFYIFILVNMIKALAHSNSVFTPKFFRPAEKIFYRTKQMFEYQG